MIPDTGPAQQQSLVMQQPPPGISQPMFVNPLQPLPGPSLLGINAAEKRQLIADYRKEYSESKDIEEKRDLLIAIAELDNSDPDLFLTALSDPEPFLRQEAAIQLKYMNSEEKVQRALINALNDPDDDVLLEVIEAVSNLADATVLSRLKQIAQSHTDQLIRDVANDYAVTMEKLLP